MRAKLVRIGNSRGVRLPKPLIEEVGLGEIVDLVVRNGTIVIVPEKGIRAGWAEAAARIRAAGEDSLDSSHPTRFEADEWEW